jgi:hypothetical protein
VRRKQFFSNFLSNGIEVATPRFMKLGELQKNYWRWMHTPEWTYARQKNVWVRLAAKFHVGKIILKNSKAQEEHIP